MSFKQAFLLVCHLLSIPASLENKMNANKPLIFLVVATNHSLKSSTIFDNFANHVARLEEYSAPSKSHIRAKGLLICEPDILNRTLTLVKYHGDVKVVLLSRSPFFTGIITILLRS